MDEIKFDAEVARRERAARFARNHARIMATKHSTLEDTLENIRKEFAGRIMGPQPHFTTQQVRYFKLADYGFGNPVQEEW